MWYRCANFEIRFEFHHYPNEGASEVLAYMGDEIVGNMEFSHTLSGAMTTNAYLEPKFRGKGYGKAMYQYAWNQLKNLGETKVLSDHKVRTDARRVYKSLAEEGWNISQPSENKSIYSVDLVD